MAAVVARRRLERGVKLNHPEAVALITDFVVEGARDGRSVAELMEAGAHVVSRRSGDGRDRLDDSRHPGRGDFPDGTKLVTVHEPIRGADDALVPGETLAAPGDIVMNEGRDTITLDVANSGDRPIQVGSHYHFFETNPALKFDRATPAISPRHPRRHGDPLRARPEARRPLGRAGRQTPGDRLPAGGDGEGLRAPLPLCGRGLG